jgi:hypothetical protein
MKSITDLAAIHTLRQQVMWPDKPIEYVRVPGDEAATHFGVIDTISGTLLSIGSVFITHGAPSSAHGASAQLRKVATKVSEQHKGYASAVVKTSIAFARAAGAHTFWCNARTEQSGFYQQFGLVSDQFLTHVHRVFCSRMVGEHLTSSIP